jgi:hypothetical protein
MPESAQSPGLPAMSRRPGCRLDGSRPSYLGSDQPLIRNAYPAMPQDRHCPSGRGVQCHRPITGYPDIAVGKFEQQAARPQPTARPRIGGLRGACRERSRGAIPPSMGFASLYPSYDECPFECRMELAATRIQRGDSCRDGLAYGTAASEIAASAEAAAASGRYTTNSLPRPDPSLWTSTRPPCSSTRRRTRASPIPSPP